MACAHSGAAHAGGKACFERELRPLADPALGGRALGSAGLERAADHIANRMGALGLEPVGDTWFQPVRVTNLRRGLGAVSIDGHEESPAWLAGAPGHTRFEAPALVIDGEVSVAALFARGRPWVDRVVVVDAATAGLRIGGARTDGADELAVLTWAWVAREAGADAVVILQSGSIDLPMSPWTTPWVFPAGLPVAAVHKRRPVATGDLVAGELDVEESAKTVRNVLGLARGSGPLADEVVVLGAHYDAVGLGGGPGAGEVYPGADDNASGVATILCAAEGLAGHEGRSVLVAAFAAEEVGLLGSRAYVESPPWPLEHTAAMVNVDMVGRLGSGPLWAEATTTGAWGGYVRRMTGVPVMATIAADTNSDHWSFIEAQVPSLFLTTGLHDDHHRTTDAIDRIDLDGGSRVVRAAVLMLRAVAEGPRMMFHRSCGLEDAFSEVGVEGLGLALVNEGWFGAADQAVVACVVPGGIAAEAGVAAGDRLVEVGGRGVRSHLEVRLAAQVRPVVDLAVVRSGERATLALRVGATPRLPGSGP